MTNTEHLEQLYIFAVYMGGSREQAFAAVCDATALHPGVPERWLTAIVRPFLRAALGPANRSLRRTRSTSSEPTPRSRLT